QKIMEITKPRLYQNGGNIIAIQLDNEIGMLSWVSNSPDLTDNVLIDFKDWLLKTYTKDELMKHYPFIDSDLETYKPYIISPKEEYATRLLKDLGYYNRNRFM